MFPVGLLQQHVNLDFAAVLLARLNEGPKTDHQWQARKICKKMAETTGWKDLAGQVGHTWGLATYGELWNFS